MSPDAGFPLSLGGLANRVAVDAVVIGPDKIELHKPPDASGIDFHSPCCRRRPAARDAPIYANQMSDPEAFQRDFGDGKHTEIQIRENPAQVKIWAQNDRDKENAISVVASSCANRTQASDNGGPAQVTNNTKQDTVAQTATAPPTQEEAPRGRSTTPRPLADTVTEENLHETQQRGVRLASL